MRITQGSGISPGKEVEDAVDIRGVADIAQFHVKVEKTAHAIHVHRKGRAVGEMVDQGVDLAQINGIGKNTFHNYRAALKEMFPFS